MHFLTPGVKKKRCFLKKNQFLTFKAMKNRITRDIKNFFEQQKNDNYKPISVRNFGEKIILDMKEMKIKIEIRH